MDSKVDTRVTRKRNTDKKHGEPPLDNRRSSEDTANKHAAFSGADSDALQANNLRSSQNPVLVSKGKADYHSFGSKNRGDRFNKIGTNNPLYTQSMDLANYDSGAGRSNLIKKSVFLPSISGESIVDDRRKFAEDANNNALGSTDADNRAEQSAKFESVQVKQQQKIMQSSKLPVIGRARAAASENTRKNKEKENDDRSGLVITNSRPVIDPEVTPNHKNSSNATSPIAFKGNSVFNHPKPVPKGPRNSTKVNEFKLAASSSSATKEKKKEPEEGSGEKEVISAEFQDNNLSGSPVLKKENSDSNKNDVNPPSDGQNTDAGVEVSVNQLGSSMLAGAELSNKTEEPSQNDELSKDASTKDSQSDVLPITQAQTNKENPPELQKVVSPTQTRKTHHSKTTKGLEEGKSASNIFEEKKVSRARLNKTTLDNQDDHDKEPLGNPERSSERRNIGRTGPRQRVNTMSINNQSQKDSEEKNLDKTGNSQKAGATKHTTSVAKNAYKTISAIAKTNEKQANRANFHHEKPSGENQRYYNYLDYLYKVSFTFAVVNRPPSSQMTYKFFIGKGNNGLMVRTLLKTRWWWMPTDNAESAEVNLIWTQLRQNNVIESLKTKKKPLENASSNNTSNLDNSIVTTTTDTHSHDSVTDITDSDSEVSSMKGSIDKVKPKKKGTKKLPAQSKTTESADPLNKLYTKAEYGVLQNFMSNNKKKLLYAEDTEELVKSSKKGNNMTVLEPPKVKICNRMECNYHLSNKKALFYNMRAYYEAVKENPFEYLPLTFHIKSGTEDKDYQKFLEYYNAREKEVQEIEKQYNEADANEKKALQSKKIKNIWIIKPGEHTNRGQGIRVASELNEIEQIVNSGEKHVNGMHKTYIVQQYMDRPLLYNKRKFDIRCYMMITSINGYMKGYWYQDGYIRTTSKEFSLKNLSNNMIHLTNDAVQKKGEEYGKFENGNKVSFAEFQKYMDVNMPDTKVNFQTDIYPKMRDMARDSIRAVYGKIDPHRREQNFEVFGLDFMIDQNFKPWIIEVNTNPCLELSAPLLARIIPAMVENALRIAVDPLFPPPMPPSSKKHLIPDNLIENNKFELIFDEVEDGPWLRSLSASNNEAAMGQISEEEEEEDSEHEEGNENEQC